MHFSSALKECIQIKCMYLFKGNELHLQSKLLHRILYEKNLLEPCFASSFSLAGTFRVLYSNRVGCFSWWRLSLVLKCKWKFRSRLFGQL